MRAHFEGVVAMRRALGTHVAQKDDMFFLCVLRAQPEPSAADSALAPPPVSPCETELEGARWMSAEEFLAGGEGIAHGGHSSEVRNAGRCAPSLPSGALHHLLAQCSGSTRTDVQGRTQCDVQALTNTRDPARLHSHRGCGRSSTATRGGVRAGHGRTCTVRRSQ